MKELDNAKIELVKLQMQIQETTKDVGKLEDRIVELSKQVIHLEKQVDHIMSDLAPLKKVIWTVIILLITLTVTFAVNTYILRK